MPRHQPAHAVYDDIDSPAHDPLRIQEVEQGFDRIGDRRADRGRIEAKIYRVLDAQEKVRVLVPRARVLEVMVGRIEAVPVTPQSVDEHDRRQPEVKESAALWHRVLARRDSDRIDKGPRRAPRRSLDQDGGVKIRPDADQIPPCNRQ